MRRPMHNWQVSGTTDSRCESVLTAAPGPLRKWSADDVFG